LGDHFALEAAMKSDDPRDGIYHGVLGVVKDELASDSERELFDKNVNHDLLKQYFNEIVGSSPLLVQADLASKWGNFKRKVKGWWQRVKDKIRGKNKHSKKAAKEEGEEETGSIWGVNDSMHSNAALDFLEHRNKLTTLASPAPLPTTISSTEALQAMKLRQNSKSYLGPVQMYAVNAISDNQQSLFSIGNQAQAGVKTPMLDRLIKSIEAKKGSGDAILGKGTKGLDIQRRPFGINRTVNRVFSEGILAEKSVPVRMANLELGGAEYQVMEYDAPLAANGIKAKFFKAGIDNRHLEVKLADKSVIMVTPQVQTNKEAAALKSNVFYTAFSANSRVPEIIFRFRNDGKDLSQVYVIRQLGGAFPSLSLESLTISSFDFQCECDKNTDMCTRMPVELSNPNLTGEALEASFIKNLFGGKHKAQMMQVFIDGSDMGGALTPLLQKISSAKRNDSIGVLFPTSFDRSLSAPGDEGRVKLQVNEGRNPRTLIDGRVAPRRFTPKRDSGDLQAMSAFTIWEYSMNMSRAKATREELIHANKDNSGKYLGRQLDIKLGEFAFYVRPDIDSEDDDSPSVKSRVWFTNKDDQILIMRFSQDGRLTHMYVLKRREDVIGLFANLVETTTKSDEKQRNAETSLSKITDERGTEGDARLRASAILATLLVECNFKKPTSDMRLFTPLSTPAEKGKAPVIASAPPGEPTVANFREIFTKLVEHAGTDTGKDKALVAELLKAITPSLTARPLNVASLLSQMTHACCSLHGRNDGTTRMQVLWEDRKAALGHFY
jgi:hypothetical protein